MQLQFWPVVSILYKAIVKPLFTIVLLFLYTLFFFLFLFFFDDNTFSPGTVHSNYQIRCRTAVRIKINLDMRMREGEITNNLHYRPLPSAHHTSLIHTWQRLTLVRKLPAFSVCGLGVANCSLPSIVVSQKLYLLAK